MTRWVRPALWALAVVAGAGAAVLAGVAVWGDLDTADRVASVVGASAALLGLVVSVVALARTGRGDGGRRLDAGPRAVVIDGDANGVAAGDSSQVRAPLTPAPPPGGRRTTRPSDVSAARDSTVVLGNATDSALGRNSERRTP
ncbi:hypothetical protein [Streptomyces sp. enrichment culture]|uniref:hypothetical protein n=1 Tax=Streptomyces sp. enrichment culture TaxID=1795815 RepID=UPI003F568414